MKEPKNILKILKETKKALEEENPSELKELSDQTIHSATISNDPDNLNVAIILYSLGKIFERQNYRTLKGWSSFKRITSSSLKCSITDLENNNVEKFRKDFDIMGKAINKISGKLKKYIEEIFRKAKITKASRIYEHGLSLGKTAKMVGVTPYEVASYTGRTGISEVSQNKTISTRERIKFIENIFTK